MNYYISDLHLFHEASIGFDGRPFRNLEEMHAEIVRKWNSKVTNGDTVYILGDMSMRGKNEDPFCHTSDDPYRSTIQLS